MLKRFSTHQLSVAVLFTVPGLSISSWVTRTPAIRDAIDASTAVMGLVLLGLSFGSMAGILLSSTLLKRTGTRPLVITGATLVVSSLPVIAAGAWAGSIAVVTLGLAMFGAGMGGAEVPLNVEGGEIEQHTGASFLPLMHGCFSLGTTVGAAAGIAFTALQVPAPVHLTMIAVVAAAMVGWALRGIPSGVGKAVTEHDGAAAAPGPRVWRDPALVLIGVVILAMALTEGTANDWLPLVMVDGHGVDQAASSAVYALFSLSMTVGRFAGGWILGRVRRSSVLAASALLGALGIAAVAYIDSAAVAALAVVLWGLGVALGFPVALSAAADSGPDSAARVSVAATLGYVAFLVGPPVLGFAGEHMGLRSALVFPLAFLVIAGLLATQVGRRSSASIHRAVISRVVEAAKEGRHGR